MRKHFFTFFTLCMLCMLCSSSTVYAKTNNQKARDAYASFKRSHSLASAVIVDLDNNKIPELLCFNRKNWQSQVYTYSPSKKKMVKLCSVNSGKGYGSYYNIKKHQVALLSCDTGGARYYVYQIKGTKATKKTTYTSSRTYPTFRYIYRKNGKKISYSTWNKEVSSITRTWKKFKGVFG